MRTLEDLSAQITEKTGITAAVTPGD